MFFGLTCSYSRVFCMALLDLSVVLLARELPI